MLHRPVIFMDERILYSMDNEEGLNMKYAKLLISSLLLLQILTGCTQNEGSRQKLLKEISDMTNEECLEKLESMGFADNGAYGTRVETAEAAKAIILYYAEGGTPDSLPFSYTGMIEMSETIWTLLNP